MLRGSCSQRLKSRTRVRHADSGMSGHINTKIATECSAKSNHHGLFRFTQGVDFGMRNRLRAWSVTVPFGILVSGWDKADFWLAIYLLRTYSWGRAEHPENPGTVLIPRRVPSR